MEVKINREIRNYTEAMFFGLSLRQFIFSACACVVAVGIYFLLKPYVGTETVSWMCILGAAPFAALGFVKYNGMILSRLVDTFFSRISLTMQPPPKPHSTACVLSWEEARRWQSRSSGCSSS